MTNKTYPIIWNETFWKKFIYKTQKKPSADAGVLQFFVVEMSSNSSILKEKVDQS